MKFELADKDLKIVAGKFVQLPMARFAALTEYVEDLEDRLLAAEVNLRESARVDDEMEALTTEEAEEALPTDDVRQVAAVLNRLEPAELEKMREKKQVSLRRLAILTGIPYATLYRYLKGTECPTRAAKNIWYVLDQKVGIESPMDYTNTQRQFQKPYKTESKYQR